MNDPHNLYVRTSDVENPLKKVYLLQYGQQVQGNRLQRVQCGKESCEAGAEPDGDRDYFPHYPSS